MILKRIDEFGFRAQATANRRPGLRRAYYASLATTAVNAVGAVSSIDIINDSAVVDTFATAVPMATTAAAGYALTKWAIASCKDRITDAEGSFADRITAGGAPVLIGGIGLAGLGVMAEQLMPDGGVFGEIAKNYANVLQTPFIPALVVGGAGYVLNRDIKRQQ